MSLPTAFDSDMRTLEALQSHITLCVKTAHWSGAAKERLKECRDLVDQHKNLVDELVAKWGKR